MNTTTTKTTHAIVTMSVLLALAYTSTLCEASLVKMGLNRDKMPVDIEEVLPAYDRFKDLRLQETRKLQVTTIFSSDFSSIPSIPTNDQDASSLSLAETTTVTSSAFNDFNETLSPFFDMDEEVDGDEDDLVLEEEEKVAVEVKEENVVVAEEHVALVGGTTNTVAPVTTITTPQTGPRGGHEDPSPRIEPTEISFMIIMDDFRYSNDAASLDDIGLGTKFGFTGRIVTKAEELGIASGSCTVTSDIKKELSYCDIYHKIDTDNFGGFGSVMVAGTADEVGGRLLVTGTGGSLQSTSSGYAMVQFDPAGNPVLYVLLKLF